MWMMAEDDLDWNERFSLAETLLDDFLLTYPVFMSTSDLCQALLGQYPYKTEIVFNLSLSSGSSDLHQHRFHSCSIFISKCNVCWSLNPDSTYCTKRCRGKEDGREALERKRKVLYLVSQWMELCNEFLRDDEHVKLFMKVRDGALCRKFEKPEWKLMFPSRLCAVTCWMTFLSTRPWKRMWGSCRNFTCCIADSEWLRSVMIWCWYVISRRTQRRICR